MKTNNQHKSLFSFLIIFIFLGLSLASCGGGSGYNGGGNNGNGGGNNNGGGNTTSTTFDSGDIAINATYSYTFSNTGSFKYYCKYHWDEGMKGTVTVEEGGSTETDTVRITGMSYNPASITIGPGTKVVWINSSSDTHTVTSGQPNNGGGSNNGY